MGQLNNLYVSSSYQGLLKMTNSATGLTNTLQTIQTGDGTNSPLQMSQTEVNISGSFYINNIPITNGTSGTSGTSGVNGSSGTSGTAGSSGSSGSAGTSGSSGSSGSSGTSGSNGSSGTSGATGSSGSSGTSGSSGATGSSGTAGSSGSSGTSGSSGSSGTSGATGSSGTSGSNGSSGTSGTSGSAGSSGTAGTSGTSGDSIFAQTGSFYATTNNIQITGSLSATQVLSANANVIVSGALIGTTANQGLIKIYSEASRSGSSPQLEAFITASSPISQSNLIFGTNQPTNFAAGSTILSGSNNIILNSTILGAAVGNTRYLSGDYNVLFNMPTIGTSSFVNRTNTTQNNNIFIGATIFDLPASGALPNAPTVYNTITGNYFGIAPTFRHKSGSLSMANNQFVGGTFSSFATSSLLQASGSVAGPTINGNLTLGNQATTLLHASSSINYTANLTAGNLLVNNVATHPASDNRSGSVQVSNNIIVGSAVQNFLLSGSGAQGSKGIVGNLGVGANNDFNVINSGSNGFIHNTAVLGQGLIVSGNLSSVNSGGTLIAGRWNATGSNQETTTETVFVVGTGTAANSRRNALRIDNNNNSNFTGSVNISGSLNVLGNPQVVNITGQTTITGSLIVNGQNVVTGSYVADRVGLITTGSLGVAQVIAGNLVISGSGAGGQSSLQIATGPDSSVGRIDIYNAGPMIYRDSANYNTVIGNAAGISNGFTGSNNMLFTGFFLGFTSGSNNSVISGNGSANFRSGSANVIVGQVGNLEYGNNNTYINAGGANVLEDNTLRIGAGTQEILVKSGSSALQVKSDTTITGSLTVSSIGTSTGSFILTTDSTGTITKATSTNILPALFNAGGFYSTGSITTTANQSGSFTFDSSLNILDGVTITNGSHINVNKDATYNLQFSIQMSQGSGAGEVAVWLKKNGSNVADSATYVTVPSNQKQFLALNLWDSTTSGSYYEIAYQSDSNNTTFQTVAATGNIPQSPSIILTVNQVR